jgi:NAD(P)H-dependent flavin oxidoreductase YrpB (nitropropane dioxygenase family)
MASARGFTDLVGCRLPLQLASLGGPIGTPALAAAVSEAGGLGTIPNPSSAAEVEQAMESARALTSGPIAIGFLIPFVAREAVAAAAASAEVVEFFYELLAAGAAAVRIGTRFLAAEESDAHPAYVASLIRASRHDTVLTGAFENGWPDAPHRVLASAVTAAERLAGRTVATVGGRELPAFAAVPPTRQAEGEIEAMAMYAGESVDAVTASRPAAEIVAELTAGARSDR